MKLAGARLESFLDAPDPGLRAILVYGRDAGLVRERADRIAGAVVPDWRDPFRVAELTGDVLAGDPARLADEAQALSLIPGRRLVRVRNAGDAVGGLFESFLKALPPGDSVVLVEAGELASRSALRRGFEAARQGAAIACYEDGPRELAALVRAVMGAHQITVSAAASEYLVANLGGDRMLSRQELEKLALYVGDGGRLDHDAAAAMVGDSAITTLDDALFAAAEGDAGALEYSLQRAFDDGAAAVTALRAGLRHFQRLHLAGSRLAAGMSEEEAMQGLRPPLFGPPRERVQRQLRRWPPRRAAQALEALTEAERLAKRTGPPPEAVCRDALLRIARNAARRG